MDRRNAGMSHVRSVGMSLDRSATLSKLLVVDIVMGAIVSILERNHSLDHFILGGDHLPLLSLAREPIHRGIRRRLLVIRIVLPVDTLIVRPAPCPDTHLNGSLFTPARRFY